MENKQFDIFDGIEFSKEEKEYLLEQEKISALIISMVSRRVELNMTQRDLAEKTGIKQPMIARIERMDSIPRLDTLVKLFTALDLNLTTVIEKKITFTIEIKFDIKQPQSFVFDYRYLYMDDQKACFLNNELGNYYKYLHSYIHQRKKRYQTCHLKIRILRIIQAF